MRTPTEWSRAFRDARGRFVATPAEAVEPSQGMAHWIDRLSMAEPLHPLEQEALDRWLDTPEGRRWASED